MGYGITNPFILLLACILDPKKISVSLMSCRGLCMLCYLEVALQDDICRNHLYINNVEPGVKVDPLLRNTKQS